MKSILFSLFLLLQITVFSQMGMYDICPIKISQKVPDAQVFDLKGKAINLAEYIGERKAILVFYRGGWCPYCMRHLSALQEAKKSIDALGYELIAFTPDDFTNLDSSKIRADFDYTLFSDKKVSAINAFGIGWKVSDDTFNKYKEKYNLDLEFWSGENHHILPVPAVFVIEGGKIRYQHVDPDYSQRLSAGVLISFLK